MTTEMPLGEAYAKACQVIGELTMQHRFAVEQIQQMAADRAALASPSDETTEAPAQS